MNFLRQIPVDFFDNLYKPKKNKIKKNKFIHENYSIFIWVHDRN